MSYTPKTWVDGEVIYHQDLNNIEQGIKTLDSGKQDKLSSANAGTGITIVTEGGITKIKNGITIDTTNNTISFGGKTYQLTEYVQTYDYFIGWWANGSNSSIADFSALSGPQLEAAAAGYMKSAQSSVTKTIVQSDIIGTKQIFFIMWKSGFAPQGGTFYGGLAPETLTPSSFTDENVFNVQRNPVEINGVTYQVVGMRLLFEAGNYFTINF